jgi:hypothetical protein
LKPLPKKTGHDVRDGSVHRRDEDDASQNRPTWTFAVLEPLPMASPTSSNSTHAAAEMLIDRDANLMI